MIGTFSITVFGHASFASVLSAEPEKAVHLIGVPFFSDNADQCGPSSLASILNFWGKKVSPADIKSDVYLRSLKGTLPLDLLPEIRAHGLTGHVENTTLERVKSELRQRRPMIAYLDFGTRRHPIGHYVVITGFDDSRNGLYVHSAQHKDKFVSYRRFERGWGDTNRWTLFVSPPDGDTQ